MTNAFADLLAATAPLTEGVSFERPPVAQVLDYIHQHDRLDTDGPWRLHPREARQMEKVLDLSPVAGFEGLVSLLAGTDALEATNKGFLPKESATVWQARSDDDVRIELCEAFTRRLVPPVAAAGLGVALRMHPLFVLTVARKVGSSQIGDVFDGVITDDVTDHCATAMFTAIGTTVRALSRLPEGVSVPVGSITDVVTASVELGHRIGRTLQLDAIEAFSDKPLTRTTAQMATNDLISHVLVPAGVAVRTRGNRVAIDSKLLAQVGFTGLTRGELDLSFAKLFDVAPEGQRLH